MRMITTMIVLLFFCYSSAMAYDDLVSPANPYIETNLGPVTLDFNCVYLSAAGRYDSKGKKQSLTKNVTDLRIPVLLRARITNTFETFALLPVVSMKMNGKTEKGIGDIWLGAKYTLLPEGRLSLRGAVNLANGDDGKGLGNTGGFGIDVGAIGDIWLIDRKLAARAQAGLRWLGKDSDTNIQPGMGVYLTGGLGYMATPQTWIHGGIEFMNDGDQKFKGANVKDSGANNLDLSIGVGRNLAEKAGLGIDASFIYTVLGENALSHIGMQISGGYRF